MLIGLNFHRMYLDRPELLPGLRLGADAVESIVALMRLSGRLASSVESPQPRVAVQLGVECAEILSSPQVLEQLGEASSKLGVELVIHHPDWSHPGQDGFASRLARDVHSCWQLGGRLVILHAPPGSCSSDLERAARAITAREVVEALEETGVKLGVENIRSRDSACFSQPRGLGQLIREARDRLSRADRGLAERIGVCLDYGHFTSSTAGENLEELVDGILGLSPAVVASHIHFNDGSGDQHLLLDERPNCERVRLLQDVFLDQVLPHLERCEAFIIERNSPFTWNQLLHTAAAVWGRIVQPGIPEENREEGGPSHRDGRRV